jgi:glycosyltransferase involved in cell wall biosynthesis
MPCDIPAKIQELGIEDRVVVHDFVPHAEVKKIYSLANSFILPSYNEGLSNAVLEAMSAGLWVIATDVGGHVEIIRNGESGFLIAPKSEDRYNGCTKVYGGQLPTAQG